MNKRLTVKNQFGKVVTCVLSGSDNITSQLMTVLSLHSGCGFCVSIDANKIKVIDYFSNETVGVFDILSLSDTEDDISLSWSNI